MGSNFEGLFRSDQSFLGSYPEIDNFFIRVFIRIVGYISGSDTELRVIFRLNNFFMV